MNICWRVSTLIFYFRKMSSENEKGESPATTTSEMTIEKIETTIEVEISDTKSETQSELKKEVTRPRTSFRKPKKIAAQQNNNTFDIKYFRGNTLPSARRSYNCQDTFDNELAQKEAIANKKNREQSLNLFQSNRPANSASYQQRRQGYNLITGEVYNDKPVLAVYERPHSSNLCHTPR